MENENKNSSVAATELAELREVIHRRLNDQDGYASIKVKGNSLVLRFNLKEYLITPTDDENRVRFLFDDPRGLWRKGDVATDLGWESALLESDPDFVPIRLLQTADGQVLSITDPFARGIICESR